MKGRRRDERKLLPTEAELSLRVTLYLHFGAKEDSFACVLTEPFTPSRKYGVDFSERSEIVTPYLQFGAKEDSFACV